MARNMERHPTRPCSEWVKGSPYSRRGAGRFDECTAPAKYLVVQDFSRNGGTGSRYEKQVCGTHVRGYRAAMERFDSTTRVLAECGTDVSGRVNYTTITEIPADA